MAERTQNLSSDQKRIADLEIMQKIGIFYVLEYTLQILFEFQHLNQEERKALIRAGMTTGKFNLPAYLTLEETFRKEFCYKIYNTTLRNNLLEAFYRWEQVLYNDVTWSEHLGGALKQFNLDCMIAMRDGGLSEYRAIIYAPFGNNVSIDEIINAVENIK